MSVLNLVVVRAQCGEIFSQNSYKLHEFSVQTAFPAFLRIILLKDVKKLVRLRCPWCWEFQAKGENSFSLCRIATVDLIVLHTHVYPLRLPKVITGETKASMPFMMPLLWVTAQKVPLRQFEPLAQSVGQNRVCQCVSLRSSGGQNLLSRTIQLDYN
jgi:hypothetical protein